MDRNDRAPLSKERTRIQPTDRGLHKQEGVFRPLFVLPKTKAQPWPREEVSSPETGLLVSTK